jgi:hypothetical protein
MEMTDTPPAILVQQAFSFRGSFYITLGLIVLLMVCFGRVTVGGEALLR